MKTVKEGMYIEHITNHTVYKVLDVTREEVMMYEVWGALWDMITIPVKALKDYKELEG